MHLHLLLVRLLVHLVLIDLILDLLSDLLVLLHLGDTGLFQLVDLLRYSLHALLEVFGEIGTQSLLFVKHDLVLQVQVVIFLENGAAKVLQELSLLDTAL